MQNHDARNLRGFSLLELVVVLAIMLIVSGISVIIVSSSVRAIRLRGSANRFAELLQTARARSAADDRFYSIYVQPAAANNPAMAYVDIFPQQMNGISGHGPAGPRDPRDPVTTIAQDVLVQPVAAAPATANLRTQFCASCAINIVQNTAPTWGPDGMPCRANPSAEGTATVCNSAGGPIAYWTFLQSQTSGAWSAVTVSPAGRIKAWYYSANSRTWAPQ